MARQTFHLPDLGEGLTEAVVVAWLVAEGDEVAVDQPIAEVETAKSIVELPTPYAGTVLKIYGSAGEAIATGAPVIEIGDASDLGDAGSGASGGGAGAARAAAESRAAAGPASAEPHERVEHEAYRTEERAGSGNVLIGYGTGSLSGKGRRRRKTGGSPVSSAGSRIAARDPSDVADSADATAAHRSGPIAVRSPIVRRLARELGVDVREVPPTGHDGVVTRRDVLAAAERSANPNAAPGPSGNPAEGLHGLSVIERAPLSQLRKMVSAKLSRSRAEIPEATVWVDVDFTELWRLRAQMAASGDRAPSVTSFVARFALIALGEYPLLASRLSDDGTELMTFDGVNLGLAVDSERGLTVPVLPQAERLSLGELDAALRELSAEARTGRIAPQKLSGSTFTFNNYGGFGVDGSAPIINHPDVAMLGMGRVIERPWVVEGEIVVRRIAQMSMVFDHRVCDGGYASGFLRRVVDLIESPLAAYSRV